MRSNMGIKYLSNTKYYLERHGRYKVVHLPLPLQLNTSMRTSMSTALDTGKMRSSLPWSPPLPPIPWLEAVMVNFNGVVLPEREGVKDYSVFKCCRGLCFEEPCDGQKEGRN